MKKVLCFGELLIRMSPSLNKEWLQQASTAVYLGGAELNVATALAKWGVPVKYFSALPDNYLSKEICEELETKNIDVSPIEFSGSRIGIYILAQGTDLKHGGVIYDRGHSSFSELKPGSINWEGKLDDVSWLHFSAISPALNENVAAVCREVVSVAAGNGITISVDLNHRAKLWQYGRSPLETMPGLVEHCDVVMGNIWSANSLLGIGLDENIHDKKSKAAYLEHAGTTAKLIMQKFPKCKKVAQTFRFDYENGIKYYAALNDGVHQFVSHEFIADTVVDKVGSGDCFMAGLIYGLNNDLSPKEIINFAAGAAVGKLQERGDSTNQDLASIRSKISYYE
jgi:2-dehydro-3-deoxygluconokinase